MENSLLKKLQIKPDYVVKVEGAPGNAPVIFGKIPSDVCFQYNNPSEFNVLIAFSTNKEELNAQIKRNLKHINEKTIFWVFYPKKSSRVASDLDLMKTWKDLSIYDLTPCASAAVNEIWTALRLKLISEVKASGTCKDDIKTNEYGEYVDVTNKIVRLPADLENVLSTQPKALNYFNSLAYSHKKEYVLWILTAKQDKTRQSRIEKALEMFLNEKKNPSIK